MTLTRFFRSCFAAALPDGDEMSHPATGYLRLSRCQLRLGGRHQRTDGRNLSSSHGHLEPSTRPTSYKLTGHLPPSMAAVDFLRKDEMSSVSLLFTAAVVLFPAVGAIPLSVVGVDPDPDSQSAGNLPSHSLKRSVPHGSFLLHSVGGVSEAAFHESTSSGLRTKSLGNTM